MERLLPSLEMTGSPSGGATLSLTAPPLKLHAYYERPAGSGRIAVGLEHDFASGRTSWALRGRWNF